VRLGCGFLENTKSSSSSATFSTLRIGPAATRRDTASHETGAGAKAANNNVDDLSEVIRALDKKAQGEFSLRLLLATRSGEELHNVVPAVHRIFVDASAQVMEETLGNLSVLGTHLRFPPSCPNAQDANLIEIRPFVWPN
jgi:hypothetical protein